MKDKLRVKRLVLINRCDICKMEEETVERLFVTCFVATKIRNFFGRSFGFRNWENFNLLDKLMCPNPTGLSEIGCVRGNYISSGGLGILVGT